MSCLCLYSGESWYKYLHWVVFVINADNYKVTIKTYLKFHLRHTVSKGLSPGKTSQVSQNLKQCFQTCPL